MSSREKFDAFGRRQYQHNDYSYDATIGETYQYHRRSRYEETKIESIKKLTTAVNGLGQEKTILLDCKQI